MMRIVVARPPNYAAIVAVFPAAANPGVIFTYGDTVFNPSNTDISQPLRAHEGIHRDRQTTDRSRIEDWWQRYLVDPAFRLSEELPAHQAEYREYCRLWCDRNARARYLVDISKRLAGPLYGSLITIGGAMKAIRA